MREARKLSKRDKQLAKQLSKTLKILGNDIDHPSLRLHKLSGVNNWSASVNKSIRIILSIAEDEIYLLEIGTHEEVY